jgi:hypothetical protein
MRRNRAMTWSYSRRVRPLLAPAEANRPGRQTGSRATFPTPLARAAWPRPGFKSFMACSFESSETVGGGRSGVSSVGPSSSSGIAIAVSGAVSAVFFGTAGGHVRDSVKDTELLKYLGGSQGCNWNFVTRVTLAELERVSVGRCWWRKTYLVEEPTEDIRSVQSNKRVADDGGHLIDFA